MNLIYIAGLVFILAVFSFLYMDNGDEKEIQSTKKEMVEPKKLVQEDVEKKKNIEILYLDEEKSEKKELVKEDKQKTQNNEKKQETYTKQDNIQIENYIVENQLKQINKKEDSDQVQKFGIYSDVSQEEADAMSNNAMLPPMAPTIISGTFDSGETYSVVVPTNIKTKANEIVITNNDEEGNIKEHVTLKPQELDNSDKEDKKSKTTTLETPPQVGINN